MQLGPRHRSLRHATLLLTKQDLNSEREFQVHEKIAVYGGVISGYRESTKELTRIRKLGSKVFAKTLEMGLFTRIRIPLSPPYFKNPLDNTSAPPGVTRLLPLGIFFLLSAALA